MEVVQESYKMDVRIRNLSELCSPPMPSPVMDEKTFKRKAVDETPAAPKPKYKKEAADKQVESRFGDVSLFAFSALRKYGEQKKKVRRRLNKAIATIKNCEAAKLEDEINNKALAKLNEKIALVQTELDTMCKEANALQLKITQYEESSEQLRMQAESELVESSRLYNAAKSIEYMLRKEFESIIHSDSD